MNKLALCDLFTADNVVAYIEKIEGEGDIVTTIHLKIYSFINYNWFVRAYPIYPGDDIDYIFGEWIHHPVPMENK